LNAMRSGELPKPLRNEPICRLPTGIPPKQ
jgi:hypothetical protein